MDQAIEFAHPGNAPILAYFKNNSVYDPRSNRYRLHTHPDLTGELHDIVAELEIPATHIRKGSVYGWTVGASHKGLLFAWAGGTGDIVLRLTRDRG